MDKFEVIRGKQVLCSSTVKNGGYNKETLKLMKKQGLTFKLNGKAYNPFAKGKEEK